MPSNGKANTSNKVYFLEIHEHHDKMYLYRACLKAVEDSPAASIFSHGMTFLGFTYSVEGVNDDPVKLSLKNVPAGRYSIHETIVRGE
ncbi:uncharacterized protein N0V89_007189 [Didymosphaeria variabile]|uniref:Uncharacterized protein n=1 Tax=Didymosphaeria variabile TaxID=1932322 RepID=A0A9W8XL00_9PLEO|nr:uncharacterized protein N0V89_007189 [Didymosphaeria variabile]KAJ4351845.1 hypothetical protein N0V89_007189 [Didymosphaeria variabile]